MDCSPTGSSCYHSFNSFRTLIGSILKTNLELNYFLFLSQPGPKPTNILSQDYYHSHLLASLFLQQLEWSFKNRNQFTSLFCIRTGPTIAPPLTYILQGPAYITIQWRLLDLDQEDAISLSSKYFSFFLFPSRRVQLPSFPNSQVGYFTGCCTWLQWSTYYNTELLHGRVSKSQTLNLILSIE